MRRLLQKWVALNLPTSAVLHGSPPDGAIFRIISGISPQKWRVPSYSASTRNHRERAEKSKPLSRAASVRGMAKVFAPARFKAKSLGDFRNCAPSLAYGITELRGP